jgi:cobalamin biosynthesis Mg chelatase CobN
VSILKRHKSGAPHGKPGRVGEAVEMTRISDTTAPAPRPSPWLGIVKFLLLVILIGIIFLLGQAMVRHRFFRGGWVDQRDVLKP